MEHSEPCGAGPEPFALAAPLRVGDESRFVAAFPSSRFCVTCVVRYESPLIGTQMLDLIIEPEAYLEQVARARTFAMEAELETLRAQSIALGGSLNNAVLVKSMNSPWSPPTATAPTSPRSTRGTRSTCRAALR